MPPSRPRNTRKRKPSPRWTWVAGGLVVLAGIVAIAVSVSEPEAVATGRDPAAVAAGADLYAANCAVCHGVDLQGTQTGPPFLDVVYAPNHHADESFQRAVVGGVVSHHWNFGNMQPVPGLDRGDVALIIEFVRSEQERNGILRDPRLP
jgi:mono/diheme cytochrome c family protein